MKKILLMACLLLALALNISCKEDCTKTLSGFYRHTIPVTLSPAFAEFNLGDTIYVRSRFREDSVVEQVSKLVFTLPNHKFLPRAIMHRISDNPASADGFKFFDVVVDSVAYNYQMHKYININNQKGLELLGEYTYKNRIYDLVYKLVPKDTGLYLLRQGSLYYQARDNQDFVQKCRRGSAYIITLMNGTPGEQKDTMSNNSQFLKLAQDPVWHSIYTGQFHGVGGYCFRVK